MVPEIFQCKPNMCCSSSYLSHYIKQSSRWDSYELMNFGKFGVCTVYASLQAMKMVVLAWNHHIIVLVYPFTYKELIDVTVPIQFYIFITTNSFLFLFSFVWSMMEFSNFLFIQLAFASESFPGKKHRIDNSTVILHLRLGLCLFVSCFLNFWSVGNQSLCRTPLM